MRPTLFPAMVFALTLVPAVTWAQPQAPADAARRAVAQQRFDRGYAYFEAHDCAAAIPEFRASLDLYASPNTRLYVGLCLQQTGALAEAYTELQRTWAEARDRAETDARYTDARDIAARECQALEPRLGRLVVRVPRPVTGVAVRANRTEVLPAMFGLPLYFDPGEVTVTARAQGHRDFQQTVTLAPDSTMEVSVTLQAVSSTMSPTVTGIDPVHPVPPPPLPVERVTGGGARVAGYVVSGLGLLGLGGFALFGSLAGAQYDEVLRACSNRRCTTARYDADIAQGETYQLAANVSMGVGIGLVVAGVIMIAVGGPRVTIEEQEERRTARITPWFDATRGELGVRGAF